MHIDDDDQKQACPYCKEKFNPNGIGRHINQCKVKHGIMIWSNLAKNKCPNCNRDWLKPGVARFGSGTIKCMCGFSITEVEMAQKMKEHGL